MFMEKQMVGATVFQEPIQRDIGLWEPVDNLGICMLGNRAWQDVGDGADHNFALEIGLEQC
jgi:hypothetical protein